MTRKTPVKEPEVYKLGRGSISYKPTQMKGVGDEEL